jgi:hypothetical protein
MSESLHMIAINPPSSKRWIGFVLTLILGVLLLYSLASHQIGVATERAIRDQIELSRMNQNIRFRNIQFKRGIFISQFNSDISIDFKKTNNSRNIWVGKISSIVSHYPKLFGRGYGSLVELFGSIKTIKIRNQVQNRDQLKKLPRFIYKFKKHLNLTSSINISLLPSMYRASGHSWKTSKRSQLGLVYDHQGTLTDFNANLPNGQLSDRNGEVLFTNLKTSFARRDSEVKSSVSLVLNFKKIVMRGIPRYKKKIRPSTLSNGAIRLVSKNLSRKPFENFWLENISFSKLDFAQYLRSSLPALAQLIRYSPRASFDFQGKFNTTSKIPGFFQLSARFPPANKTPTFALFRDMRMLAKMSYPSFLPSTAAGNRLGLRRFVASLPRSIIKYKNSKASATIRYQNKKLIINNKPTRQNLLNLFIPR